MKSPLRIVLTLLVCGVIIGAVVMVIVRPLHARIEADQEAIRERREQLVKLERVARRITSLQDEIERLEAALEFFENRLPEQREIDVILREVWMIAETQQLNPRSVRTTRPVEKPRYNSQPITLTLEGPFDGFYEFMLGLERLPRLTKIREMEIQRSPVEDGWVLATLLVDIFYEK